MERRAGFRQINGAGGSSIKRADLPPQVRTIKPAAESARQATGPDLLLPAGTCCARPVVYGGRKQAAAARRGGKQYHCGPFVAGRPPLWAARTAMRN